MTNKEFNEKWTQDAFDRMRGEDRWEEYIEDCFDMYETEGFTDTFNSPYEQYRELNGMPFKVLRRGSVEDGWDIETLPAWKITFEDGLIIDAFPEEICKIEQVTA